MMNKSSGYVMQQCFVSNQNLFEASMHRNEMFLATVSTQRVITMTSKHNRVFVIDCDVKVEALFVEVV